LTGKKNSRPVLAGCQFKRRLNADPAATAKREKKRAAGFFAVG